MTEEKEKLPRSFYPGMISIEEAAREYNIPDTAIDDMLDRVEEDILDGLAEAEEPDDEQDPDKE
jgi:predicted DNA-binding protein YlxM (UPF0122 family)